MYIMYVMCEKPFFVSFSAVQFPSLSRSFSHDDPGPCCMRARLGFHGYLFYIKTRFLRVRPPPPLLRYISGSVRAKIH